MSDIPVEIDCYSIVSVTIITGAVRQMDSQGMKGLACRVLPLILTPDADPDGIPYIARFLTLFF